MKRGKIIRKKVISFVEKYPLRAFYSILGIIVLLIIISNLISHIPKPEQIAVKPAKLVHVYQVGSVPKISVQAQVEKSGVIKIVSLSGGVVQSVFKTEGNTFVQGETLVGLSTNYQGGNSFSLSRQLAQTQYNNIVDTFPTQKEIIQKQKEIAEKTDTNNDKLRDITNQSIDETKGLISLNEEILRLIDEQIAQNSGNDALILALKQQRSQFLAATNAARNGLRVSENQVNADNPAAQLSDLQKEVTTKQLEIQDKMLEVNKELSRIQLLIAQVNEGLMFPSAPFSGTVQKVFVKVGEAVQPGKELMVISQDVQDDPVVAIAYVSNEIARKISRFEESTIHLDSISYSAYPSFISTEAVQGTLYAVYFPIPENYAHLVTEKGYIQIDLPIGYYDTSAAAPFLPIDALYQTQDSSYIFVAKNGIAKSKLITVGQVYGSFVEVTEGLNAGDQVILDRTVIAQDTIKVAK